MIQLIKDSWHYFNMITVKIGSLLKDNQETKLLFYTFNLRNCLLSCCIEHQKNLPVYKTCIELNTGERKSVC